MLYCSGHGPRITGSRDCQSIREKSMDFTRMIFWKEISSCLDLGTDKLLRETGKTGVERWRQERETALLNFLYFNFPDLHQPSPYMNLSQSLPCDTKGHSWNHPELRREVQRCSGHGRLCEWYFRLPVILRKRKCRSESVCVCVRAWAPACEFLTVCVRVHVCFRVSEARLAAGRRQSVWPVCPPRSQTGCPVTLSISSSLGMILFDYLFGFTPIFLCYYICFLFSLNYKSNICSMKKIWKIKKTGKITLAPNSVTLK